MNYQKEVKFYGYCKYCKYMKRGEGDEPCYTCLSAPAREGTIVPLKFEAKVSKDGNTIIDPIHLLKKQEEDL